MRKNSIFSAGAIFCLSVNAYADNAQQTNTSPSDNSSRFENSEGDIKWHGPGFYYGKWFETKAAYDSWLRQEHKDGKFEEGDGSHEGSNGLHGGDAFGDYGTDYGPP